MNEPSPRCPWAKTPVEIAYHDGEWCRPCHDDRALFELLELEGFQAGLTWRLILERRPALRAAFADFDPAVLSAWTPEDEARALQAPGVVKNRRKAHAAVVNARAFQNVQVEYGSFDSYLWSWVDGQPIVNHWQTVEETPAQTPLSQALSADLKKRGFQFVGPVICYSYLQAAGLIDDHLTTCPFHGAAGPQA